MGRIGVTANEKKHPNTTKKKKKNHYNPRKMEDRSDVNIRNVNVDIKRGVSWSGVMEVGLDEVGYVAAGGDESIAASALGVPRDGTPRLLEILAKPSSDMTGREWVRECPLE